MIKDYVVSLLLSSQAGTERPESGISHGKALGKQFTSVGQGWTFPPGFTYLAAWGACSLASDQVVAQEAGRAGPLPQLGTGFSLGKPLLPRSFCFLIGKLKFLGKTCRFCRKSSFWWRVTPTRHVSVLHTLLPCRQNAVAWAEHPGLINSVLFVLTHSDYQMKIVWKSAAQSTIIKSLKKNPLSSILAFKLQHAQGQSVCVWRGWRLAFYRRQL